MIIMKYLANYQPCTDEMFKNYWIYVMSDIEIRITNNSKDAKESLKMLIDYYYNYLVKENKFIYDFLCKMANYDMDLLEHSIATALYSLALAIKLGLSKTQLDNLFIGAILHDVGFVALEEDLFDEAINNDFKLNSITFPKYKSHTTMGMDVLDDLHVVINNDILRIILLHHMWEKQEESIKLNNQFYYSFPLVNKNTLLSKRDKTLLVKIVQVADIYTTTIYYYDRFTSASIINNQIIGKKVKLFNLLRNELADYADLFILNLIINHYSPFRTGQRLLLNNGKSCYITGYTVDALKPIVTLEEDGKIVNLYEERQRGLNIFFRENIKD